MENSSLPVAIIGGGPVGLAAAAHLTLRGIPFLLFESGSRVAANMKTWSHVRVFSPWRYNIDKAAEVILESTAWTKPDEEALPSGQEMIDSYLQPLSEQLATYSPIYFSSKVLAVGRKGMDKMKSANREKQPFVLQVDQNGENKFFEARAVIDASGTWQNSNPIGSGGMFAFGEIENSDRIFYGIPDVSGIHQQRYANKDVLVVGGGHSAINSLLELEKLLADFPQTRIHWVLRKKRVQETYGGQADDALPARGTLGIRIERLVNEDKLNVYTPFQIQELVEENGRLTIIGDQFGELKALEGIDEIISNTGTRPDMSFLREVRVEFDSTVESVPAIADLIDPNIHSCGTVRPHGERELRQKEKDFYVVGMKSYGRAPTFLMATGYEQVRSITAALAGDFESAAKVELDLPQTGVCGVGVTEEGAACCA